jgi:hypothetical protein
MSNSLTGLLHRMFMDAQPKDVLLMFPALLSYDAECAHCSTPATTWKFLSHAKVSKSKNSLLQIELFELFRQHQRAS